MATGSAEEVRTALRVAVAWGDLGESEVREALELLDRLAAVGWRLTHRGAGPYVALSGRLRLA